MSEKTPSPSVGIVCLRGDSVLLVRRGNPPLQNEWSVPGGRIEWGETAREAALRELAEETGVEAELGDLIDVADGVFKSRKTGEVWAHYVMIEYAARWRSGEPMAGDDAAEARFFPLAQIDGLEIRDEIKQIIRAGARLAQAAPSR
jgi:8-oxo-dGTP diphosphatase